MNIESTGYKIFFESGFDDDLYQFEVEAKGYLYGTILKIEHGEEYRLNFYNTIRFKQDVDDEINAGSICYYEENVIMISKLSKEIIINAIQFIWDKKLYTKMVPMKKND